MGTLSNLKDAALEARKASLATASQEDRETKGVYASFLMMVLSNVQASAKATQREPTDDDATKAIYAEIKAYEKSLNGVADLDDPSKNVDPLPADSSIAADLRAKCALLQGLVPQMVKGADLIRAIQQAAVDADVTASLKTIGPIMKALIAKYGAPLIDGKDVKAALTAGV